MKKKTKKREYTLDELGEMLVPGIPTREESAIIRTAILADKERRKRAEQRRNRRKVLSK
ncbi:MAG TPA: hypothetical protein VE978_18360 [Chitinophagales bacterium]|nr:hypothetical protein [Chitinophagales bacterium]